MGELLSPASLKNFLLAFSLFSLPFAKLRDAKFSLLPRSVRPTRWSKEKVLPAPSPLCSYSYCAYRRDRLTSSILAVFSMAVLLKAVFQTSARSGRPAGRPFPSRLPAPS